MTESIESIGCVLYQARNIIIDYYCNRCKSRFIIIFRRSALKMAEKY